MHELESQSKPVPVSSFIETLHNRFAQKRSVLVCNHTVLPWSYSPGCALGSLFVKWYKCVAFNTRAHCFVESLHEWFKILCHLWSVFSSISLKLNQSCFSLCLRTGYTRLCLEKSLACEMVACVSRGISSIRSSWEILYQRRFPNRFMHWSSRFAPQHTNGLI